MKTTISDMVNKIIAYCYASKFLMCEPVKRDLWYCSMLPWLY